MYIISILTFILNIILLLTIVINYLFMIYFSKLLILLNINNYKIISFVSFMLNSNINLMSKLSLFSDVNYKKLNLNGKKIIINCNHIGEVDDLLVLIILKKIIPNFNFRYVKSISCVTTKLEEEIFNNYGCIIINKDLHISEIEKKIDVLINNNQMNQLILFFEGAARNNYNNCMKKRVNIDLINLDYPKTSLFDLLSKKKYFDYIVDVNVIYHNNNKILNKKTNIIEFLNYNSKAKVKINLYKLPNNNYEEWLLKLFQKKDIELEYMKKDIVNINI